MERLGTFFGNRTNLGLYSDSVYTVDSNGNCIIDAAFRERLAPDGTAAEGYVPQSALSKSAEKYYYRAARIADAFVKDEPNGITTGELAKEANDKWFRSRPICKNGNLQFITGGDFIMDGAALHYAEKKGSGMKVLAVTAMGFDNGVRELFDIFID